MEAPGSLAAGFSMQWSSARWLEGEAPFHPQTLQIQVNFDLWLASAKTTNRSSKTSLKAVLVMLGRCLA